MTTKEQIDMAYKLRDLKQAMFEAAYNAFCKGDMRVHDKIVEAFEKCGFSGEYGRFAEEQSEADAHYGYERGKK